jgi:NTP pyrophosphatase (non-canonical NTP hydrolase)
MTAASYIFGNLLEERARQDMKWGEQNHDLTVWLTVLTEEVGEVAEAILTNRSDPSWENVAAVRDELVQVAAVAVATIEFIDRGMKPTEADR